MERRVTTILPPVPAAVYAHHQAPGRRGPARGVYTD